MQNKGIPEAESFGGPVGNSGLKKYKTQLKGKNSTAAPFTWPTAKTVWLSRAPSQPEPFLPTSF